MMYRFILPLLIGLAACSTNTGRQFDVGTVSQLHNGTTDKTTVLRLLGNPGSRTINDNNETWIYSYMHFSYSPSPLMFVPVVQIVTSLPGGPGGTSSTQMQMLSLTFSGDVLQSCSMTSQASGGDVGAMGMGGTQTSVNQTQTCGK